MSLIWGGIYPLPDPRHGGHPSLGIAILAVPFVLSLALWRLGVSRAIKAYLIATIVLLLVLLPMMMIGLNMHAYDGPLRSDFRA